VSSTSLILFISLGVLVLGQTGYMLWQGRGLDFFVVEMVGAPAAAVLLTVLAVAIDRAVLKWFARRTTLRAALLVALLNVVFVTLATGPWLFHNHLPPNCLIYAFFFFLESMSLSTLFPALIAGLIIIVMGLIALHRVLWPLMARPVYALAQHGVIRQHKLLGSLGFALFALGIGSLPWLISLGKIVGLK
jgi:hypothetical protein